MARVWRLAPLVLVIGLAACSGKAGRVTMRLEPNSQGIVLVQGNAPTVRVTNGGPAPIDVDIEAADASGDAERITLVDDAIHTVDLPGSTRFAFLNVGEGDAIVEMRVVRYRRLIIERSPAPVPEPIEGPTGDAP